MSTSFIIALSVAAVVLVWLTAIYNELTKERILVDEGLAGIDAGLQERYDLIPNLVETVKGYVGHEHKTLVEVIKWRNRGIDADSADDKASADKGMTQALADFFSLSEAYPDLKANANFLALQESLGGIEEKLNSARRYYNGTVREYNQSIAVFPKNLVAGGFGFRPRAFFSADDAARTAPGVKFN